MIWRIGVIGFGNVGQGFVKILANKGDYLEKKYGFRFKIIGIADPVKGNAYDEDGLDIKTIIDEISKRGDIRDLPYEKGFTSIDLVKDPNIDIIVEATPTNIESGEPGLTHIREALRNGKHVVTSNKGPIALAYKELTDIAKESNVYLRFEGTVMSGTPVITMLNEALAGCNIDYIEGILNGTTNFILTKMEMGYTYDEALREAQRLGYAEADPTADVDGWDAAIKTVILANTVMDGSLTIGEVDRTGIRGIDREDIEKALKIGRRVKLLARIWRRDNRIEASVKPVELPLNHPLANIMGVKNAILVRTDHLGDITLIGSGAGRIETGQALLSDILYIHRQLSKT